MTHDAAETVARLATARFRAATRWPYLASGLFAMSIVVAPGLGTAAIDERWRLYVDPEAIARWTVDELAGVWNHELQHLLREHGARARRLGIRNEDRLVWNVCADAEINDDLTEATHLPGEPVLPSSLGLPDHRSVEEYWFALAAGDGRVGPESRGIVDEGPGVHGVGVAPTEHPAPPGTEVSELEGRLIRRDVARQIRERQRGRGDVPAGLRRLADDILGSTVDWRQVLVARVRAGLAVTAGRTDYSYRRVSRRASLVPDVVLPAMVRHDPSVAVVVDTSGSVSDLELRTALGEVLGLIERIGVRDGVRLIACDAAADRARSVRSVADLTNGLTGGGGTDLRVGIAAAAALRPAPDVVVVFTDGETPWPDRPDRRHRLVVALFRRADDVAVEPSVPGWASVVPVPVAT